MLALVQIGRGWLALGYAFLYLPIAVVVVMSFNASKLPFTWTGFSLRWTLPRLVKNWVETRGLPKDELESWTDALKDAVSPALTVRSTPRSTSTAP